MDSRAGPWESKRIEVFENKLNTQKRQNLKNNECLLYGSVSAVSGPPCKDDNA